MAKLLAANDRFPRLQPGSLAWFHAKLIGDRGHANDVSGDRFGALFPHLGSYLAFQCHLTLNGVYFDCDCTESRVFDEICFY